MPSVYGQRQKDNNFTVDGVENRDPDLLGVPLYPPPEAIAEMKMESGVMSGVYGHASGATVNIVTKSGSNEWHGAGWEFLRNNDLDARSFFLPAVGAYHWNQFGGEIGGPLTIPKLCRGKRPGTFWLLRRSPHSFGIQLHRNGAHRRGTQRKLRGRDADLQSLHHRCRTERWIRPPAIRQ